MIGFCCPDDTLPGLSSQDDDPVGLLQFFFSSEPAGGFMEEKTGDQTAEQCCRTEERQYMQETLPKQFDEVGNELFCI